MATVELLSYQCFVVECGLFEVRRWFAFGAEVGSDFGLCVACGAFWAKERIVVCLSWCD